MKEFFRRLSVIPFEAGMAFLALCVGTIALLHLNTSTDALTVLLPPWLVTGLNVTYAFSGLAMLLGIGLGRRDVEGFGIALLMSAVLVRGVAIVMVAGITEQVSALLIFYFGFLAACASRLWSLIRNEVVLKLKDHGVVEQNHEDIDAEQLWIRHDHDADA